MSSSERRIDTRVNVSVPLRFRALNNPGSTEQTAQSELAKLNGDPNIAPEKTPQYQQAQAQVNEMQRQLDHTTVRAPFEGVVSEVDSLQPGTLVISAMSAFSTTSAVGLVATKDVWVEAQMKETDLTLVKPGQPVDVEIDTYRDAVIRGDRREMPGAVRMLLVAIDRAGQSAGEPQYDGDGPGTA